MCKRIVFTILAALWTLIAILAATGNIEVNPVTYVMACIIITLTNLGYAFDK